MSRRIRKWVLLIAALATIGALLGTGFALWAFNTRMRGDSKIGLQITESAVTGTFSGEFPSYAVLEEGTAASISSTVTGISFYREGRFYKDGYSVPSETQESVLLRNAMEVKFTMSTAMGATQTEDPNILFGIRLAIQPGLLSDYIRLSAWYHNRRHFTAPDGTVYVNLKNLVESVSPVLEGKPNYEFSVDQYGKGVYTFRFTAAMYNMCFEYVAGMRPETATAYAALTERLKNSQETNNILLTLWQGYVNN